jgi:hypothetical protein
MDDARPQISPDEAEEALADQLDNVVPSQGYQTLPVVALGGSDSGIAGLRAFFQALPAGLGWRTRSSCISRPRMRARWPRCCRRAPACGSYRCATLSSSRPTRST